MNNYLFKQQVSQYVYKVSSKGEYDKVIALMNTLEEVS